MAKTANCAYCEKEFTTERHKQIYCSPTCRMRMGSKVKMMKLGRTKKKKGESSLRLMAIEARKEGLTYGQYVAKYGL